MLNNFVKLFDKLQFEFQKTLFFSPFNLKIRARNETILMLIKFWENFYK